MLIVGFLEELPKNHHTGHNNSILKMKNVVVILIIIIVGGNLALSSNLQIVENKKTCNDQVLLFIDRNLYIVGESLYFGSYIYNSSEVNSRVLYVELISHNGVQIQASKFKIENGKAIGSITISKDIPSGNYFLKAYTRWMRNFNPAEYSYTPIIVINPTNHSPQHSQINDDSNSVSFYEIEQSEHPIRLSLDQINYQSRDNAYLNISSNGYSGYKWLCLTIAPKASLLSQLSNADLPKTDLPDTFYYGADKDGFTLTAKALQTDNESPSVYKLINISILSSQPDFLANRTDSLGFFSVNLPEIYGSYDLYVGVEEGSKASLKFDNDFCTRKVRVSMPDFSLSEEQFNAATNIINNVEVLRHFSTSLTPFYQPANDQNTKLPFYGTPDINFVFNNFVDLLSVKEYFHELLPISIREKHNKTTFRIHGNYSEFDIYEPLVLIDNIVIDNPKRILAAKPDLIDRIEIITKPYYKGNMVYAGIISFYSKEGDFARIELSESDMFIKFKFFDEIKPFEQNTAISIRPDTRNTLLWVDDLTLSDENITLDFLIPDTKGDYEIQLRGIDNNGKIVFKTINFSVD